MSQFIIKLGKLLCILCDLDSDNFSFNLIKIREVFECKRDLRLALPSFHKLITRCREDQGGVGMFIKENINYKILSVFIPHIFESLFVETSFSSSKTKIVGVVYRPNSQPRADLNTFMATFDDIMRIINTEKKHSTIMGDFNIDLLKYNIHEQTNYYVDNIFENGFMPLITKLELHPRQPL